MKFKQILAAGTAAAILFSASACSKEEIQQKIQEEINEKVFAPYTTVPETEKPAAATTTAIVYTEPSASDFTYYEEDGGIVIMEYKGSAKHLAIPAEIDGLPVTTISGGLTPFSKSLRSVIIPETVTTLRVGAFYNCEKLIEIVIPESVTDFGDSPYGVFENTVWLRKKQREDPLVIVNHVLIDGKACTGDVVIPEGVTQIAAGAFRKCPALTGVTLPSTLEKIGNFAFDDCTALERIEFPDKTIEFGLWAFGSTVFTTSPWLKKKRAEESLVIVNHVLIDAYNDNTGGMIPDTVTAIAGGAFSNAPCEHVVIPDGVTKIPTSCFVSSSLKTVVIPDSVTEIGSSAFCDCQNLEEIVIPDSVTKIGANAFIECESLKKITLPDGLKFLGEEAFSTYPRCDVTYRGKVYTSERYNELYAAIEANR